MKKHFTIITYIFMLMISLSGCKKFLEPKPLQSLAVPSTLKDLQALLDDQGIINSLDITATDISSDDLYLTLSDYSSLSAEEDRRMYTWENDHIFKPLNDWSNAYKIVYSTNVVLDNIDKIQKNTSNQTIWNDLKGQALFVRAKQFLSITITWAPAYDPVTSKTDLGIPLRLDEDFNKKSIRANVAEGYDQIISDLKTAIPLLNEIPLAKTRASRGAALGLLSRTYMAMGKYDSCFKYVDLYLQQHKELLNYNTEITTISDTPLERFNKEVCYDSYGFSMMLLTGIVKVDSSLYDSYQRDDLRKSAFFISLGSNIYSFKGNYSFGNFGGIATDEMYLMRAECNARIGNIEKALSDLNKLMINRWKSSSFIPFTAGSAQEVLQLVLIERRKELLFRGLRWMDLKRLNKEGANITLKRKLGDRMYQLQPNDKRYALSIPEDVISLTGMPQNAR